MNGTVKAFELTDDLQKIIGKWKPVSVPIGRTGGTITSGKFDGTPNTGLLRELKALEEETGTVAIEWKPAPHNNKVVRINP
jgi:hypothetical protein